MTQKFITVLKFSANSSRPQGKNPYPFNIGQPVYC